MIKKLITLLLTASVLFLLCINSFALSDGEAEKYFKAAVIISSYCGPVYPLGSLLSKLDECGINGIPTREEQFEKYKDNAEGLQGYKYMCTWMTLDDLNSVIRSVFSDELADYYFSEMFKLKNRKGEPAYREMNGLIYDFGDYGDPGGIRDVDLRFTSVSADKYKIHVKYRYGWDLDGRPIPTLEDDLILTRINGTWKFTEFVSPLDRAFLSIYPDAVDEYPENWINPKTSDSAVYIAAAAGVIALCCAVICKKKIKT